jgi:photosystem II stability/assembly factor-like uncharacterized protein
LQGTTTRFNSISFPSIDTGFVVGGNPFNVGAILKTINGGEDWINQISGINDDLLGVSFSDGYHGIAVGSNYNSIIINTTDGGMNWNNQNSGTYQWLHAVSFANEMTATAVGEGGIILRTTNGGINWILQSAGINEFFRGVCFIDSEIGTIVGMNGTILRTTNGGNSWTNQSINSVNSFIGVSFVDADIGTIVGQSGKILRTTNGGTNWNYQNSGTTNYLYGVSFIDENNGIVVGEAGKILRTTNGGVDWIIQQSGTINDLLGVCFINEQTAYICGSKGTILKTLNGGIMPVELTSFSAIISNSKVQLYWSTATELNNHGFEIERSLDKTIWATIGFREGYGTRSEPQDYTYSDDISEISSSKFYYRLKQIDFDGSFEYSDIVEVEIAPSVFFLSQNYPNPFNPSTSIQYAISSRQFVTLKVYDVLGKEIATLVNEERIAGTYEIIFNSSSLASGIYYYQIRAGDYVETKKMILMK